MIETLPRVKRAGVLQLEPEDIKRNENIFRFLNDKDRDILYLVFVAKKKQQCISRILRCSQPLLVYNIRRIKERVRFIAYLREVYDVFVDFVETRLSQYTPDMAKVLVLMYYTTSYTLTGRIIGSMKQFDVKYIFDRSLERMRLLKHWDAYELFSAVHRNKGKVKRVHKSKGLVRENHSKS